MKRLMFKKLYYLVVLGTFVQACDVAYKYDIESGTDEHKGDSSNVTIDTARAIDISMYDRARIFPGLVDTLTERRIADTSISLDLSIPYIDAATLGVASTPLPIYSTGLYAGAGELVTIMVEEGVQGLTVQVGSHMDDLTNLSPLTREPVVYTRKQLFPGKNFIRNNLGGYIWVIRQGSITGNANFKLNFSGVYKAPDYIANTGMDPAAWARKIRATTVPWLELRGKHVAFSVSRARMENKIQEDPDFAGSLEDLIGQWDQIVETYYYGYYGLTEGNSDPVFQAPEFPERVVLDVQLEDNVYMRWSGQPIVALNTNVMVNDLTDRNALISGTSVNIFKAMGNNYALSRSPWWPEVSNAASVLPLYRLIEQGFKEGLISGMSDIFLEEGAGINEQFPLALSYAAADSSKWLGKDELTNFDAYSLLPLVQLAHYDSNDWDFYTQLHKSIKGPVSSSGITFFFGELCRYFEKDFSPFFDHWGIDLPDRARAQGSAYPLLGETIWEYNPLAHDPAAEVGPFDVSKYPNRHDRTNWDIVAYDADYLVNDQVDDAGAISLILDGQKVTRWHSWWRGGAKPLPHYIIIDMKNRQEIDGFFFANGEREYRATRMILETTDAENIEFDDMNVEWYKFAEIRPDDDMDNYSEADNVKPYQGLLTERAEGDKNEKFYEFINSQNIRYIRVVLPDIDAAGNQFHTMAEFGTFYYR